MKSVINYIKENGIKLAANSKANMISNKLLQYSKAFRLYML